MAYINVSTAAQRWGITVRRVQELCQNGTIKGAERFGRAWMIPENTQKPHDKRTKTARWLQDNKMEGFMEKNPRRNPFLIHTDLYSSAGTAQRVVDSFAEYPKMAELIRLQFDVRRGRIDSVLKGIEPFLKENTGFYLSISLGVTLSFCAIWKGDINLWETARQLIYNAPFRNENELEEIRFWIAVIESNIHDVRSYPDWFTRGDFECLPADSYSTARVFYAKKLFIVAEEHAVGKTNIDNLEKMTLMKTIPYVLEPMISQAKIEKTLLPEIYLRFMAALTYKNLGENEAAIHHIDKGIDLCLPDRLYGVIAECRAPLGNLLDDRLILADKEAYMRVKALSKSYGIGWIKLHNALMDRHISDTLTERERDTARFAAMGLSNAEIAKRLNLEISSVKQYIFSSMNKCGAKKRSELGMYV